MYGFLKTLIWVSTILPLDLRD